MAKVYEMDGVIPVIDPTSFVHPDAVIIGDVIIGPCCYIGACACLRGDLGRITIGSGTNIQDSCVVHCFPQVDVIVEENCHVGHGAILHGCIIGRNALVGMNSVVMDHAVIGENSFVSALSFVKSGMLTGANMLIGGVPAKEIRPLKEEEILWKSEGTMFYQRLAGRSIRALREAVPLASAEPDRRRISFSDNETIPLGDFKNRHSVK
jgi:carbonic anhydrase/acetyltransferase-like protein (isoleucine patch superfamily)